MAKIMSLFGKPGVNRIIRASRALAARIGRPGLAMNPEWIGRLMVAMGRRLKWKDIRAHEHGWVFGEKEYGNLPQTVLTPHKRVQLAPPTFVAETRRLLAADAFAGRVDAARGHDLRGGAPRCGLRAARLGRARV